MLIDSHRISLRDRAVWESREQLDARLAVAIDADAMEATAVAHVAEFLAAGPAYVSTSWGKDSVVVAHIAALADPTIETVWVRSAGYDPPESERVRDAFLADHPRVQYREVVVEMRNPKRGQDGYEEHNLAPKDHQDILKENLSGRYVSGVRAEESRIRRGSLHWHGISTANTCRPIITWHATDVFAYLHSRGLPVHPIYAMSRGGHYDRQWLRVHQLGSSPRDTQHLGHQEWEDHYYPDILTPTMNASVSEEVAP